MSRRRREVPHGRRRLRPRARVRYRVVFACARACVVALGREGSPGEARRPRGGVPRVVSLLPGTRYGLLRSQFTVST